MEKACQGRPFQKNYPIARLVIVVSAIVVSAEDQIIAKLTLHRDIKELLIDKLRRAGILCHETDFTDSKGDIFIENLDDITKAKEIIQELQQKANP
jgi:hypothetical protein